MTLRRTIPRTEERIFPPARRASDPLLREHRARYRHVAAILHGRILDLGCGTGYGCHELAAAAPTREVVGLDRSGEALDLARRYYADPKVTYAACDLTRDGWDHGLSRFDAVVAFEVLEHLETDGPFWGGISRLLREGGILWLSTPLGRGRGKPCADPFHVHQLRPSEVRTLLGRGWTCSFYGQFGEWIEPWLAGRRYYTILVRAIHSGGSI